MSLLKVENAGLRSRSRELKRIGRQTDHRFDDGLATVKLTGLGVLLAHDVLADVFVAAVAEHAVRQNDQQPPARFEELQAAVEK